MHCSVKSHLILLVVQCINYFKMNYFQVYKCKIVKMAGHVILETSFLSGASVEFSLKYWDVFFCSSLLLSFFVGHFDLDFCVCVFTPQLRRNGRFFCDIFEPLEAMAACKIIFLEAFDSLLSLPFKARTVLSTPIPISF